MLKHAETARRYRRIVKKGTIHSDS